MTEGQPHKPGDDPPRRRLAPFLELARVTTAPDACSYLDDRDARFEYRTIFGMSAGAYDELLRRGWRRFGYAFFRPRCVGCRECVSLRVPVEAFAPTKSQRRARRRNAGVTLEVREPAVSDALVRLYDSYHDDMSQRRGWEPVAAGAEELYESFVAGAGDFGREFRYSEDGEVIGIGFVDATAEALSSVYFVHDPRWRPRSPGTYSILRELEYAQETSRRWLYLGYWIEGCPSMAYKSRFGPHEVLERSTELHEPPRWGRPADVLDLAREV